MTTISPPLYVEAPATTPHPFGLLSVAVARTSPLHWQAGGVEFEPARCDAASLYALPSCEQVNAGNTQPVKTYADGVPLDEATPFVVYGSFSCSPIGNWSRAEDLAKLHLSTGRERALERAIETGAAGATPSLNAVSTADVTPVPGTGVDIVEAVGLLEAWIAGNTTGGVIHLSPLLATRALAAHLLIADGAVLRTKLGTPVIVGAGYTGLSGPAGDVPTAGDLWAFASGTPQLWLGEPFLTSDREQSLNIRTNDLQILAEQTALVGWACGAVGVLVNAA